MARREQYPSLRRFLLADERVVVAVHQHWSRIAGPIALTLLGLFVVLWFDAHVTYPNSVFMRVMWIAWLGLVGWLIWQLSEWRSDWFLATDKRLLLRYGLLTRKVAMMPLSKVTDMSYGRSVPGRVFGYGYFVLESAGQDQALRTIDWVPHPDQTYRVICAEIFGVQETEDEDGYARGDDGGAGGRGGPAGGQGGGPGAGPHAGPARPSVRSPLGAPLGAPLGSPGAGSLPSPISAPGGGPLRTPLGPVEVDDRHSRAIPIHRDPRMTPMPSGEIIYSSDDARRRRREAETGPMLGPDGQRRPRRVHRPDDDD